MSWSTPLTGEPTWLSFLENKPLWKIPERPTLIVAPHPDDETLGAGGLIAIQTSRNLPVSILAVSDGEAAYPDSPGLAATRISEQVAAAGELGVASGQVVRLGLPDSRIEQFEDRLISEISSRIDADTLLVAPWELDPHPDHQACGRAAIHAARRRGSQLCFYMFWAWHRYTPQSFHDLPLRRCEIPASQQSVRAAALACHHSQLVRSSGDPILPEILLTPAQRGFETFIVEFP